MHLKKAHKLLKHQTFFPVKTILHQHEGMTEERDEAIEAPQKSMFRTILSFITHFKIVNIITIKTKQAHIKQTHYEDIFL